MEVFKNVLCIAVFKNGKLFLPKMAVKIDVWRNIGSGLSIKSELMCILPIFAATTYRVCACMCVCMYVCVCVRV